MLIAHTRARSPPRPADCKALPSEKKKACAKANANKVQKERAESGKKDYVRKASTSV